MPRQIIYHVTALISEQFSEFRSDHKFYAKLGKHILQNTKADLKPWHALISSRFLQFTKGQGTFWTTSQHWFQNSFWIPDRTIGLLRNQANIFYRIQRQYSIVLNGIVCFAWYYKYCIVLYFSVWYCMVLYSIIRYWMALLYGISIVLYYIVCYFWNSILCIQYSNVSHGILW